MKKGVALFLCICMFLSMCLTGANAASENSVPWTVRVTNIDVVEKLETQHNMTSYDGSTYVETYTDEPQPGNIFAVALVALTKQDIMADSINLAGATLTVDGKLYTTGSSNAFFEKP